MEKAWQAEAQGRLVTREWKQNPCARTSKTCLYWLYFCELTGAILMTDRMFGQSDQLEGTRLTKNVLNFSPDVNFFIALK